MRREAYAGGSGRGRGGGGRGRARVAIQEQPKPAARVASSSPPLKLHVHDLSFSTHDLLLNSEETFPQLSSGDLVQLYVPGVPDRKFALAVKFLSEVTEKFKTSRLQVSMLKSVAEAFGLTAFSDVCVYGPVEPDDRNVRLDFLELHFKDQFITRGDMWRFTDATMNLPVHRGKVLNIAGIRARVEDVKRWDSTVESGVLMDKTRVVFRSRSARIFWLVQMSAEMWKPFDSSSGELYFERFINGFVRPVLQRWRDDDTSHSLSVVFFSRTRVAVKPGVAQGASGDGAALGRNASALLEDAEGRLYRDFYKMVVENEEPEGLLSMIPKLKEEFMAFPRQVGWGSGQGAYPNGNVKAMGFRGGSPCGAAQGNFLEAINVTLNVLDKHFMDRDLMRTGNSIVMISPSCGNFRVESKLAKITKQRMMDNGIGMDMISLSMRPLHTVPIFVHREPFEKKQTYEIPHWMNLSYLPEVLTPSLVRGSNPSGLSDPGTGGFTAATGMSDEVSSPITPALTAAAPSAVLSSTAPTSSSSNFPTSIISGAAASGALATQESFGVEGGAAQEYAGGILTAPPGSRTDMGLFLKVPSAESTESATPLEDSDSLPTALAAIMDCGPLLLDENALESEDTPLDRENGPRSSNGASDRRPPAGEGESEDGLWPKPLILPLGSTSEPGSGYAASRAAKKSNQSALSQVLATSADALGSNPEEPSPPLHHHHRTQSGGPNIGRAARYPPPPAPLSSTPPSRGGPLDDDGSSPGRYSGQGIPISAMLRSNSSSSARPQLMPSRRQSTSSWGSESLDEGSSGMNKTGVVRSVDSSSSASPRAHSLSKSYGAASPPGRSPVLSTSIERAASSAEEHFRGSSRAEQSGPGVPLPSNAAPSTKLSLEQLLDDFDENLWKRAKRPSTKLELEQKTQLLKKNAPDAAAVAALGGGADGGATGSFAAHAQPAAPQADVPSVSYAQRHDSRSTPSGLGAAQASMPAAAAATTSADMGERAYHGNMNPKVRRPAPFFFRWGNISREQQQQQQQQQQQGRFKRSKSVTGLSTRAAAPSAYGGYSRRDLLAQPPNVYPALATAANAKRHAQNRNRGAPATESKNKEFEDFIDGFSIDFIDPFQKKAEEKLLTKRTPNRRRWSHVIPLGELEFKHELKWKSLSTPAVLPLTTDYCPKIEELKSRHFSDRLDQMDLSSHASAMGTYRRLLVEMVTQRLTFDYQLVDAENNQTTTNDLFYTLSMGHRVHRIACNYPYDQVHITEYTANEAEASKTEKDSFVYRYLVWVPLLNDFQEMVQSFKRYAEKVKWNVIDQLIVASTELDPLNTFIVDQLREKNTKYKRLLFAILPPALPAQCRPTAREWLKLHLSKERTTTEALPDHREQGRYRQARRFEVPFFLLLTATTCSLPRFACATQCRRRPPTTRSTSATCASTSTEPSSRAATASRWTGGPTCLRRGRTHGKRP